MDGGKNRRCKAQGVIVIIVIVHLCCHSHSLPLPLSLLLSLLSHPLTFVCPFFLFLSLFPFSPLLHSSKSHSSLLLDVVVEEKEEETKTMQQDFVVKEWSSS